MKNAIDKQKLEQEVFDLQRQIDEKLSILSRNNSEIKSEEYKKIKDIAIKNKKLTNDVNYPESMEVIYKGLRVRVYVDVDQNHFDTEIYIDGEVDVLGNVFRSKEALDLWDIIDNINFDDDILERIEEDIDILYNSKEYKKWKKNAEKYDKIIDDTSYELKWHNRDDVIECFLASR